MRPEDVEPLKAPYDSPDTTSVDQQFAVRLGVGTPSIDGLAAAVLADLSPELFGVGWWAPGLDARRRILAGDHLYVCLSSIGTNLVEAKLHLLEALDVWQQEAQRLSTSIRVGPDNRPRLDQAVQAPIDHLPSTMERLHVAGVARAVASALDCLAAGIVGVAGLPIPIYSVGFKQVLKFTVKPQEPDHPGGRAQNDLLARLKVHMGEAGPDGWLTWVLEYRNMLVHKGRQIQPSVLKPTGTRLHTPGPDQVLGVTPFPLLPKEPGLSEIDALRVAAKRQVYLTEHASVTLDGVLSSTVGFIELVGADLLQLWKTRRAQPGLISQPAKQWPADSGEVESKFAGYREGQVEVAPDTVVGPPTLAPRLKAASLEGDGLARWEEFPAT